MADLTELQASQSVKVVGADSTGAETNYQNVDSNGTAQIGLYDNSGSVITAASNGVAGNNNLHVQTPDTISSTTSLGVLNSTVSIEMAGLSSVGFQILAGTLIGTLTPECSIDGGTTWTQASFYDPSNSTVSSSITFSSANTTKVLSIIPIGGSSHVRVLVSAYTSGTAVSLLRASQVQGAVGAITSAAFGTVTNNYINVPNNTATLLLAANPNRKYAYFSNNSSHTMNIQFGSSTGLSSSTGLVIVSYGIYELKGDNLYTGNIYGYSTGGSSQISVTEGTP